jgi:molybdopterin synthase sulfur carrier subunit
MATVHIPAGMRKLTGETATVTVAGATLGEVVDGLELQFPGIRARLASDTEPGRLRPGLAAFVDGVQASAGLATRLGDASEVYFTPAIAGG